MTDENVWLITGAARGMGLDIAKAALAAGHAVVATARNADSVTGALGQHDDLLAVTLDVTDPAAAEAAVKAALDRFDASTCSSTTPATSTPGSSRS
jgi:NAD(P)-dependent dehydrogenase (short-subunit alcohol dehydrogenase family)